MKRLGRILFNIVVAVSLPLCLSAMLLWARSYRVADSVAAGYWNYRPHVGAPDFQDADMLQVFHAGGRWTITRCRRYCVAFRSKDASTRYDHRGPGDRGDLWLIEHPDSSQWAAQELEAWGGRAPSAKGFMGVHYLSTRRFPTLRLPDALLVAALSLAPVCLLVRRQMRSRDPGRCEICGYDLRATPHRCPECGTAHCIDTRQAGH